MEKRGQMKLKNFVSVITFFLIVISLGGLVFHKVEGWRYIDAFYFSVMTVTTVGYGDFTPHTDLGKILTMLFAFAGIAIALYVLGAASKYFTHFHLTKIKKEDKETAKKKLEKEISKAVRKEETKVEKEIRDVERDVKHLEKNSNTTLKKRRLGYKK